MILTVASTAMSVVGAISQGNAAAASYKAEAQAQEYNAQVARNKQIAANREWSAREDQLRRQRRMQMGENRASTAQSGFTDSGSILDMFDQSAIDSELDILNSRYEGQLKAQGYGEEAELAKYGARVARSNASAAKTAGWMNAAGAVLGGVGNYYSYKREQDYRDAMKKSKGLVR